MTRLRGAEVPLAPSILIAHLTATKKRNLERALKNQKQPVFKKNFRVLFQVIFTNEVPVTIL